MRWIKKPATDVSCTAVVISKLQAFFNKYKETGCEGVDWIQLAQDWVQWRAVVNTVMKLRVP